MITLTPRRRTAVAGWVFAWVIVVGVIAQAVLAIAWYDARGRLTAEELATRQENISQVETCYRQAASRLPLLRLLNTIEGNTNALLRLASIGGDSHAFLMARKRLVAVREFQDSLGASTPSTTSAGRVPECELEAQALHVRLELVGRNPDGTPRP